jgi:hypothetical protein
MRGPYRSLHSLQGDKETDPGTEAGMTFPLADTALIAYSFPPALSPGPRDALSNAEVFRGQHTSFSKQKSPCITHGLLVL